MAQDTPPQLFEIPKTTKTPLNQPKPKPITPANTSTKNTPNPLQTPETLVVPTESIPKKRRRRPTLQDSIRLAAMRADSLAQAQNSANNNSAFNVNQPIVPTTALPINTDSAAKQPNGMTHTDVPMLTSSDRKSVV